MTKEVLNTVPEWQMDDAYGSLTDPRWMASGDRLVSLTNQLAELTILRETLGDALTLYEDALTIQSSMACFAKCLGAKDSTDALAASEADRLASLRNDLEKAAAELFKALMALEDNDALWSVKPFSHWHFVIRERQSDWHGRLSASDAAMVSDIEARNFNPLGNLHKALQKLVDFEAKNAAGETVRIRAAKMVAVLKGDPDGALRQSVGEAMQGWYQEHADLYAGLLNQLHGIRITNFEHANVDPLEVSLAQNRMSRGALEAIRTAILRNADWVRDGLRLRTKVLGGDVMGFYDVMAPAPEKSGGVPRVMPYEEGIGIVMRALGQVSPEMPAFIDTMLKNHWLDAKPSDKKVGGAFYSRFNQFRIPRVFSTYLGSITSVLQQGHELGHAFHYWTMRDLPMIETEFPMTLTETASTFNEAVIRHVLLNEAQDDERFKMLWQDMRSAGNFLLNTMVRMDFELQFLEERRAGVVSANRCREIMRDVWHRWYGDDVTPDEWLWAHKLHYYKTDQFIYNYPYTVGYVMSLALMREWEKRGDDFYDFYVKMLRDTGRMTVDEIIRVHFGADATDPAFWEDAIQPVRRATDEFRKLVETRCH